MHITLPLSSTSTAPETRNPLSHAYTTCKWSQNELTTAHPLVISAGGGWVFSQLAPKILINLRFPPKIPTFYSCWYKGFLLLYFFIFLFSYKLNSAVLEFQLLMSWQLAIVSSRKILLVFWIFFRNACFKSHFCTWTLKK